MASSTDPQVEAIAGSIGTLVSTTLLYPVEVAKTKIQAGISRESVLATIRGIVRDEKAAALFKGLPPKALHVVLTNYLYLYIYEWLKRRRAQLGLRTSTLANTVMGVSLSAEATNALACRGAGGDALVS